MDARTPLPTRRRVDKLLIALFLGALAAPWVDELVRPAEARSPEFREQRAPAAKPQLALDPVALWKYPEQYESWFNDSFGLRDQLLRWHSLQSLNVFHVPPTTKVLLGRGNWMFYTGDESIPIWRGLLPFTRSELERWRQGLEARRDWLATQGIAYLFVIAPNKESIYPEMLPDAFDQLGPTRLDQLVEYLAQHSDLDFLDLRPALRDERAHDAELSHVYFEEGTHWNGRGSKRAYREIITRLGQKLPGLVPLPDDALEEVVFPGVGETWGRNMYIEDLRHQREVAFVPKAGTGRAQTTTEGAWGPGRRLLRGTGDDTQPRAVMFHDSFGPYVENLLSEHFARLACFWTYAFEGAEILEQKPQVVFELWVERALWFREPRELPPKGFELAREAFDRAQRVALSLDVAQPQPALEGLQGAQVRRIADEQGPGIAIELSSAADSVLTPPLAWTVKDKALVQFMIDSPVRGNCDLLFLQEGDSDYTRRRNCVLELERGHNEFYVRLPESGATGRLRLRPTYEPGVTYVVRRFEVRSLAPE